MDNGSKKSYIMFITSVLIFGSAIISELGNNEDRKNISELGNNKES